MKKHFAWLTAAGILTACSQGGPLQVSSPDGKLLVNFNLGGGWGARL